MNEWLIFSLLFLGIWIVIFIAMPRVRKEMFFVSLFTMPFGLTEFLFVPKYCNPPSLFNLAETCFFYIKFLFFFFAFGEFGVFLHEAILKERSQKMRKHERRTKKH